MVLYLAFSVAAAWKSSSLQPPYAFFYPLFTDDWTLGLGDGGGIMKE